LHDSSEPACNTVVAPTPDENGNLTWELFQGPTFSMKAGFLVHTVPCWGYVFTEKVGIVLAEGKKFVFVLDLIVSRKQDQPGALDLVKLMASPLGGKRVGPWLAALKSGQTVDGVTREEVRTTRILPVFLIFSCYKVCGPALVGRKVVVLGDTCDPSGEDMKLSLRNIF
jgi:hypothetical protein